MRSVCSENRGPCREDVLRTVRLPEEDESILEENGNPRIHDWLLCRGADLKVRHQELAHNLTVLNEATR